MPPSSDPTLDAARAWAEKQATDLAAQAKPAPFAEVGTDIHEDMARIYEITCNVESVMMEEAIQQIATIARGWIED